MIFINQVRLSGGTGHQHITDVGWRNPDDGKTGVSTTEVVIDWIDNKGGAAKVTNGKQTVDVGVVQGARPFLRTHADGVWTDNLLALPRF